jgi:hypothetical protein
MKERRRRESLEEHNGVNGQLLRFLRTDVDGRIAVVICEMKPQTIHAAISDSAFAQS